MASKYFRLLVLILIASVFWLPLHAPLTHADAGPTIVGSNVTTCGSGLFSCAVTVASGGTTYMYGASIGGSYNISTVDFLADVSVRNQEHNLAVLVGHSSSNTGTFNPGGALFPNIGGIGVIGTLYQIKPFSNVGEMSITADFDVPQQSLVIMVLASSNNLPGTVSTPFIVDQSQRDCCDTVMLAHANMPVGPNSITVNLGQWSTDTVERGIGLVLYFFSTLISTTTHVVCSPLVVLVGATTTCTASVTGSSPTGIVAFSSSSGTGSFNPSISQCTLSLGTCSVSYVDSKAGSPTIRASYVGDSNNAPSADSTTVTIATQITQFVVRETGLTAGTTWSVTLQDGQTGSSVAHATPSGLSADNTIMFFMPTGKTQDVYVFYSSGNYVLSYSLQGAGTLFLNVYGPGTNPAVLPKGNLDILTVVFTPVIYKLQIVMNDLPSGFAWGAKLASASSSPTTPIQPTSCSNSILGNYCDFSVTDDNYRFAILVTGSPQTSTSSSITQTTQNLLITGTAQVSGNDVTITPSFNWITFSGGQVVPCVLLSGNPNHCLLSVSSLSFTQQAPYDGWTQYQNLCRAQAQLTLITFLLTGEVAEIGCNA